MYKDTKNWIRKWKKGTIFFLIKNMCGEIIIKKEQWRIVREKKLNKH